MEYAPPPATRMTAGLPLPVQCRCSLRPPMSTSRPGGGYPCDNCGWPRNCAAAASPMIVVMMTAAARNPACSIFRFRRRECTAVGPCRSWASESCLAANQGKSVSSATAPFCSATLRNPCETSPGLRDSIPLRGDPETLFPGSANRNRLEFLVDALLRQVQRVCDAGHRLECYEAPGWRLSRTGGWRDRRRGGLHALRRVHR